ncbi:juvenile hormone esterase-like [Andrena cerasifolii]|uniref:juvenile hormone esterase-like n=1 Tax=Andrena cerasifolii TaxID=2819439 RepID=UPI004037A047
MRKVFAEGGNMKYTFSWVVAALLTAVHCERFTEVVTTDKGAVRGTILKTVLDSVSYAAFLGIPYAKPPVGELRFRDPIEADPWTGVLNATEHSAMCIQDLPVTPSGSEDCLYLNVFTPQLNLTKIERLLPVMIWIYGGAYVQGSISRESYGPDIFLANGVVFVDMDYRLGPLGFLALGLDGARGNQALKDQNMAMRWVQKNIANFGGDPNQVTVFGESAGAVSVMYHLLSPQSKGLFQQAIAQSGSPLCPWAFHTPELAALAAYELGAHMGIVAETKEQLLDALKKADIKDIIKSVEMEIIERILFPITLPFNPTIDAIPSDPSPEKVFLDDCPISKLQSGDFQHVPMIYGYNKDEGILLTLEPDLLRNQTIGNLNKLFAFDTTGLSRGFTSLLNTVATGTLSELTKIATDFYFAGPIDYTQKMLAKYSGKTPVYYYRLSYSTNLNGHKQFDSQINGTSHGDDLTLLFVDGSGPSLDPNSKYNMYRKKLVSLWTNFAKYGNPTPHGEPVKGGVWLPSGEEGRQIDLGNEEFKMHDRLLDPATQKFASFYTFILPHISACVPKPWNPFGIL